MTTKRLVALVAGALLLAGLMSPANALAPDGVSGRLIAPDGSPQAGALVRLMDMSTGSTEVSTTSAADGTFSFTGAQRPATFAVQVCQDLADEEPCLFPPQSLDFVKLYVGPADREFSLPALTSYFVTDESSPALALGDIQLTKPATVVVKVTNGLAFSFRRLVNVSSMKRPYNRSALVFQGLAPGRHLVRAFGQRQFVTVGAGQTATTVISKRQPAVKGRVVLNGRPVRNAPVTLSGANDTSPSGYVYVTKTGADGRYSFRGLSFSTTPWRLRIGAEVSAKGTHALAPGTPHRLAKFRLSPGQTKTVDLVTRSALRGTVRMRFSDTGDDIISRRAALFTTGGELVGALPLRQGGSVVGGLAPGRYIVAMKWFRESGIQLTDWAYLRVRAQRTVRTALAPRYARARVNVYAPTGSTVHLIALFPSDASASLRQYVAAESTQVTDTSGITVFARVPLGMYRVYMSPSDDRPDETTMVNVRELRDEHTEVDLSTPSPEASIRGRLVNPATGQPWPWTRAVARTLDCNGVYDGGTEYIEDGGYIVVDELHSGRYTCQLVGLRYDRGTPYEATTSLFHPVIGTYDVISGQQREKDFPLAFARRTG